MSCETEMREYTNEDENDLTRAERDVRARAGDLDLDYASLSAISNVFRAANAIRNHMERQVLRDAALSWSSFVALFVLWVWGEMETAALAEECAVSKGTLTGVLNTLEKANLTSRSTHPKDGRRVLVKLTPSGKKLIAKIFPAFNHHESMIAARLSDAESRQLAHLLREVVRGVKEIDDV
jgi:MarR family transcriptional regulator, organic hydroperoxide resistance regulator